MSKIDGNFAGSYYSDAVQQAQRGAEEAKVQKTKAAEQTAKTKQPKLSAAARKLLEKLKKNYDNMAFMVADYGSGAEAKEILSRGTKEYSVLFSADELEKMASDEKYEKEYMERVEGAVCMSNQINEQFGFGSASAKGELTSVGISFNSDGSTTLFAELEKSSEQQRTRIEAAREKRAEERKEGSTKKVTVQASSQKELIEELNKVDWRKVRPFDRR